MSDWTRHKCPQDNEWLLNHGIYYATIRKNNGVYDCTIAVELAGVLIPKLTRKSCFGLSSTQADCEDLMRLLDAGDWY